MIQLIKLDFPFKFGTVRTLIGVLVLLKAELLSACPQDYPCSCKNFAVHCADLQEVPENIPGDTLSLILEHGQITSIEKDKLAHLGSLSALQIIFNNVSVIEQGAFDNLTSLRELSLWSNNIAVLSKEVFSNLQSLKKLTLSDNKLQSLEGVLDGLVLLEILSVDNNQISTISPKTLRHLKNLHHLKLDQNNLQSIPEGTFANNKNMMLLSLGSNPIKNTENAFPQDMKLHYLNLTDCKLTSFPKDLPLSLQLLTLSKNNITTIQVEDTIPYKHFTALVLDENKLSSIQPGAFKHMKQLRDLFLFVNELEEIPGPFPSSIKNIHLDNNKIKAIYHGTFQEGTEISLLSLRTNEISYIDKAAFAMIKSIEKLELETNLISVLQDGMFTHATGLQLLSLNMLHLEAIHTDCLQGLESLHTLKMSHVKVAKENIQGNFFKYTKQLQILNIENSPSLAQFVLSNTEVMQSLSSLQEINLKQNRLTILSMQFSKYLPHLNKINLARNHFNCTPSIMWLRTWQRIEPNKFVEFSQVRCHTPPQVQGQRLSDLELWQFYLYNSTSTYSPQLDDTTTTTPDYYSSYYHNYEIWKDMYDDYYDLENISNTTIMNHTNSTMLETSIFTRTTSAMYILSTPSGSDSLKSAGIATGMALAVIVVMLLIAAVIYICCSYRRNRHLGNEYLGKEDYVFIVSKTEIPTETNTRPRMTREERGSTTSKASEDITNHTDLSMKVYTLDVDA